jgi:hypothetical protein
MGPTVVVAQDTWSTITQELDRVSPREGVVLPLVSLVRGPQAPHPCGPTHLHQLAGLVLADAVLLPPALQRNTPAHVAALRGADDHVNQDAQRRLRHAPCLRTAAYLHSHPFASGHTWPSGGDIHGHMVPLLRRNTLAGLHASFSLIACRDVRPGGWVLQAFAMGDAETVVDLGTVQTVAQDHPWVLAARLPSLRLRGVRGAMRRWRKAARAAGSTVLADDLMDGWMRLRVPLPSGTLAALLEPLHATTAHAFHILHAGEVRPLDATLEPLELVARVWATSTRAA